MKAKELAKLLMENPDMEVVVDCCINTGTYENPYPEHETYSIDDVNVWCGWNGATLVIECS
jgi:hypothetical protein